MKWTLPIMTDWMQSQMVHEPSRSYAQEIYEIVKQHPYKKAVEIGCDWGLSTLAILLAGKGHLTAVDVNDKTHAPGEIMANKLVGRWGFWHGRSEDFWKTNEAKYDLIYIDGSHLYADFRNDIFKAWEVLEPKGLLICDDITHKANLEADPSTMQAEYGISFGAWEFIKEHKIEHIHTTTRLLYIYKAEQ